MKVIVAGSREIKDFRVVEKAINDSKFEITELVSGTAKGVDQLGEKWAKLNLVPCKKFPADWNTYGKRAGYLRNVEMAEYADALIAVWDTVSRGTAHMIAIAKKKEIPIYLVKVEK